MQCWHRVFGIGPSKNSPSMQEVASVQPLELVEVVTHANVGSPPKQVNGFPLQQTKSSPAHLTSPPVQVIDLPVSQLNVPV